MTVKSPVKTVKKDKVAQCCDELTTDETQASALATVFEKYQAGKTGTKTALLREVLAAIYLSEEDRFDHIDGEVQDRNSCNEKTLHEVSTKNQGGHGKGNYNN